MWKSVRKGEKDRVSEHKKRLGEAAQSIWCDCPHLHLDQFRDARHCHINFRNFIPGTVVNDAGDRQVRDFLRLSISVRECQTKNLANLQIRSMLCAINGIVRATDNDEWILTQIFLSG